MLATRFKKWCLIVGCTFSLLIFQNCAQNFESVTVSENSLASSEENSPDEETETPTEPPTAPPTTPSVMPPVPPPVTPPVTPPPTSGRKNVFMATGHVGRTVFSCDDGRTWIHDRSDNNNTRCWMTGNPNYVECDHTLNSGRGLDAADGMFFANFGWGYNGSVRRSEDGVNWQTVNTSGWGGGLSFDGSFLFVTWSGGVTSSNLGNSWQTLSGSPSQSLDAPFVKRMGSTVAMIGRPTVGRNKISISLDSGRTWSLPASLQNLMWIKSIEKSTSGRLVIVGSTNNVSYSAISDNNGSTWTIREQVGLSAAWDHLFYDGQKFISFASGRRWISTNGLDWTSTAFTVSGLSASSFAGPISLDPTTGTFVRILDLWDNYYDRQKAYRSTDGGLTWQVLSSTAFRGGHPIRDIKLGEMDADFCE